MIGFGDLAQGNGDSTWCCSDVRFHPIITPCRDFVLLDNFYCSGISAPMGHQWTDEAYVTDYLEKSFGDLSAASLLTAMMHWRTRVPVSSGIMCCARG
jgi:hypothetical protein